MNFVKGLFGNWWFEKIFKKINVVGDDCDDWKFFGIFMKKVFYKYFFGSYFGNGLLGYYFFCNGYESGLG